MPLAPRATDAETARVLLALPSDEAISDTTTNCWWTWLQTTLQMLFKATLQIELIKQTKLLNSTI